jgi:hypothetical protein
MMAAGRPSKPFGKADSAAIFRFRHAAVALERVLASVSAEKAEPGGLTDDIRIHSADSHLRHFDKSADHHRPGPAQTTIPLPEAGDDIWIDPLSGNNQFRDWACTKKVE